MNKMTKMRTSMIIFKRQQVTVLISRGEDNKSNFWINWTLLTSYRSFQKLDASEEIVLNVWHDWNIPLQKTNLDKYDHWLAANVVCVCIIALPKNRPPFPVERYILSSFRYINTAAFPHLEVIPDDGVFQPHPVQSNNCNPNLNL